MHIYSDIIQGCLVIIGITWFFIWLAFAFVAAHRHLVAQQDAMIGLMAAAAERNAPLSIALSAIGDERNGWMSRRAKVVVELLASGMSLTESLRIVPKVLSADALPLVSIGDACGLLGPALRRVAAIRKATSIAWQSLAARNLYLLHLPVVFICVIGFLMMQTVPYYEKIFEDFGASLPASTRWLFNALEDGATTTFFVLACIATWLLMYYALLRCGGVIRWDLPGFGLITRRLDRAVVLDSLSLAAVGQRPLPETVGLLADTYPKQSIRRRLQKALVAIEHGQDGFESLKRCDLLGPIDLAVLQAAQRNGNIAWAAQEMADSNRRRFQYIAIAWMQMTFPALILVMACITGIVAVGMFMPLIKLILTLAK